MSDHDVRLQHAKTLHPIGARKRISPHDHTPQQRPVGGLISPGMVLLVEHGVEGVVTRAAQVHGENEPVITEASALLHTLGMDLVIHGLCPSAFLRPPPPPRPPQPVDDSMVGTVVTIEAVLKASICPKKQGGTWF